MPPRRSTRSATVEPEPKQSATAAKRKRSQAPSDDAHAKENEVTKPARSTIGSSSKGRISTRPRVSLKEVQESSEDDDEGDVKDSPPPVKKLRPSPEVEDSEDDSNDDMYAEEEEVVKPKGRKSVATKKGKSKAGNDTDEEWDEPPKTKPTSRKSTSRAPARKSNGRKPKLQVNSSDDHAGLDLSDEDKPASKGQISKSAGPSSFKASARATSEDMDDSDIEPMPMKKKTSKSKLPARRVAPSSDDPDAEKAGNNASVAAMQEEEIDESLLDPVVPALSQSLPHSQAPVLPQEPQGPKSRLTIHKMALVNFKSYAGRQEIGPFHKSFSSIVGPNGSGKSNTIDALLFVFGYRASKMRQGKLSELIHNSARYSDLSECSVEVHFREIVDLPGPDAYQVVPNSNLVVARTAFKNNSSKYTINARTSNFTEVQTLLKGRGIDLDHKRFLILQGEVESIAQMKPKAPTEHEDGLLEYLEDIIGTSKYKTPIDEALVEMERLSEDRGEKLNRLRIVEREKNALEEKKREAEDYLRLMNEHVRALSRLWQWYLWKCLLNEEEFSRNIARYERELAEETERNKDDITHLEALEKHYVERGKAYEEVKAAAAEAVKDLAAHEKQQAGLEERSKHAKSKAKKLKKSLQDDENAKAAAIRTIKDSADKMKRKKTEIEEHESSLDREEKVLEGIRDSLKDKTQVFHDQIEVKQKELQPWTGQINAKQADVDVASSERDALVKKAEAVRQAGKDAQEALKKLQADQELKFSALGGLKSEKEDLQNSMKNAERKLQEAQSRVQDLRTKASSSHQKAEEAKSSQAASTSQNKVLDSLTRLRNAGRINGFHGRLGSLGTIPDKYDVAVSTACGALNNLVVDTVEQGQSCIEYLRKQNVGRASFMVLEKLPSTNSIEKITTPENVPRLFDLIKPKEPRFAPAFYKGVGNTLVADNLDQANRIAFGSQRRWRVVTLSGQLIDSSGTMSGGGNHVAKGGMSSKLASEAVSPQTLKVYEKESEDSARLLEEALQILRRIEAEVENLGKSGPQTDIAMEKINLDIQGGTRRIAEAEKRVREFKSQSKPDAGDIARISTLEKDIAAATTQLKELQEKSGAIEKAIRDLEKKILDIGGAKLLTQKSKVDGIRLHINLANDEITKAEVAKAKAEKDTTKFDSTIETNRASLDEVEGELGDLTSQLEECVQYVTELRSQVEAAQAAAEHSKDDLESLKSELDTKTEEIQAFRQKEMELQQSLNDTKKEAADNERTLQHWQNEHDKLKLEDIDDDEVDEVENQEALPEADTVAESVDGEGTELAAVEVKQEPDGKGQPQEKKVPTRTTSYELHIYSAEELAAFKKREMVADAELLDEKLKNAKPNLSVLKEYRKREQEFLNRAKDLEQITNLRDEQKQKYDGLRKQRLDEFMAGFSLISMKLKEMYQMITLGGNAELELVDSMDPFSEGIIFSVMPPKKSWKNISNLSGGEKTLSSLALVFALHVFKPTPLYFMDEIDAALDFRNVSIVANYIKDRTKNAQFIIISLRNDMFELANRLIGIYKTANATQSISIDNHALTAIPVPNAVAA